MRVLVAAAVVLAAGRVDADPMPSGSIGLVTGAVAGTGSYAKRLGAGLYEFGAQAAWQPQTTERRWGWGLRWATMFGVLYDASAATIERLRTVQMDLTGGLRFRPWATPNRYLTGRAGIELLRTNEPIPTPDSMTDRAFLGAIASVGIDQYLGGFLFNVDVRYGMIASGPEQLALLIGISLTGP